MDKRIKLKKQEYDDMQSHVADKARETFRRPAYPVVRWTPKTSPSDRQAIREAVARGEIARLSELEYLGERIDVTRRVQGEQRNPD